MPPPHYTRLASETLSSKQPQGPELDSKGQSQGHPNTAHRAPQGPSASHYYQPPHTHPSTKSAKGEGKKKTRNRNKTSSHQQGGRRRGGREEAETERIRPRCLHQTLGEGARTPAGGPGCAKKATMSRLCSRRCLAPPAPGAPGTAPMDACLALLPQGREGRPLPTRVRGALGLRAAPLGSDLQLPKLVASEVSAQPREGSRRRRRVTGGEGGRGRPQGSSGLQDAPSPRVPDPGLRHPPESPEQAAREGPLSLRAAQPTRESGSSGCATTEGPRVLACSILKGPSVSPQAAPPCRVRGAWP